MTDQPLRLLAKLDIDHVACWWERWKPGYYREYESMNRNLLPRTVPADRLTPVKADFHRWVGDAAAIAEVWQAREHAERNKS